MTVQEIATNPLISVILSVYNGGEYLKESVHSVLNQSFIDFELLINDDYSTDSSLVYLETISDPRVKIFKQDRNRGLFPCLNELVARSKGNLIKLWSQDDIMNQNCLKEFAKFHEMYPQLGFSYCDRDAIDENGNLLPCNYIDDTPAVISPELHARIAFYSGSIAGNIANTCIRREALEKVGLFHEEMDISADFEMWVRLAQYYDTGYINHKLVKLRNHKKQLSRNRQYFIRRPIEDMQVFNYLLSYVSEDIKKEGLRNLRKYKFVYYYTLMIKALIRFRIGTALRFFRELYSFGGFMALTRLFIKSKISPPPIPDFILRKENVDP